MTTNTDLHGAMPELPVAQLGKFREGTPASLFLMPWTVPMSRQYIEMQIEDIKNKQHPSCAGHSRHGKTYEVDWLYTADQMREYVRALIQQAAVPEGLISVPRALAFKTWHFLAQDCTPCAMTDCQIDGKNAGVEPLTAEWASITGAATPAPPKQQPALGRGGGGGVPLTDEYVAKVVRSVQPHLSVDSKAWRDQMGECFYWLKTAQKIDLEPRPSAPTGQINPDSADLIAAANFIGGVDEHNILSNAEVVRITGTLRRLADQTKEGPA